LIMTVLAVMPVILATILLRLDSAPTVDEFEQIVLSAMLAGSIAPLIVLAIAAAAFSNEVEDSTLANLTLSPLPRWQIVVPKLLAAITIAAPFMVASAFLTSHIAFIGDTRATIAVTVSALVGVALYASAFVWLGLVSSQAIGVGLLYIVLWEGLFAGFVHGIRLLSIRHYAIAIMHGLDARRFVSDKPVSLTAAIMISVVIFAGFAFLAVRRLRRMDVP
jgi:ABC-2 type transport system permease protein